MTKCYEVSSKRFLLTARESRTVYNREENISIPCRDEELFDSLNVGDFVGVDKRGEVVKRISKERYILSAFRLGCESVALNK
ncbi:MAG: hypothetical protein SLAVMIC_00322 [uncultured marine phage]|uniref:Uncharacterized protein n=1 Tax=uncultured marine phage TaxID=707152 RepID=A0A8D9CCV2_9VIRU|nr:MAG: hypothetical protein SLAVMIC_00322 [uncultured marine phage]